MKKLVAVLNVVTKNMNKYLAELPGTFALVFCGTGAIVINQQCPLPNEYAAMLRKGF